ncbi:MAG: peptide ABC transporter substrate-binding protein, partial [Clostridiales bacterium]|nr:peptide ABC transporter substrate-binding protein [Clostridiales bacterium]
EYDNYGMVQPCLAEKWEVSEDGLTWTFHIRKGAQWVRSNGEPYGADTTAHDFVFTARYILDAANGSKTADLLFVLKNGEKFYNGECAFEDVGVKALDDYTLQYTLETPIPYFLSMLTYVCFFPANEQFVTECGEDWGITDKEMLLYNGAYRLETFDYESRRVYVRNELYWDLEDIHITKISRTFNKEAATLAPEMLLRGEVNYADIPASQVDGWLKDPAKADLIRPVRTNAYSYFFLFNFWPNFDAQYEPDNWLKAANNLNFRKSFYHALDRKAATLCYEPYVPESKMTRTITPANFAEADGVDYTQMGDLKAIADVDPYDVDKALSYKAKAVEELTAQGVTFPVKVYMPYNAGQTEFVNMAQVVEQQLERALGADYIDIIVEGYPDTDFLNVTRRAGNYCFMMSYWGPDYADPLTYTDPFAIGQKYNYIYMADGMGEPAAEGEAGARQGFDGGYWKNAVYDTMVNAASAEAVDMTARYTGLANAEAWLIDNALVVPWRLGGVGYVSSYLSPFDSQYAPFGVSEDRYKYQTAKEKPMNTEEFKAGLVEWEAERARRMAEDAG